MGFRVFLALLLFTVKEGMEASAIKSDTVHSIEETVILLKRKNDEMEARLLILEMRDTEDALQKVKEELLLAIQEAEKKSLEEKKILLVRIEEVETALKHQTAEIKMIHQKLLDTGKICYSEPPSLQNGTSTVLGRSHGSIVQYVCDRDFVMKENSTVQCLFGKWEGNPPTCKSLESCYSEPPSLENGKWTALYRNHGSIVQYVCDRNFVMTGNSTVQCRNGKWEGSPPYCVFFDATFTVMVDFSGIAHCYSDENYEKIEFSQVLGTSLDEYLPIAGSLNSRSKHFEVRNLSDGVYQCKYNTDQESMKIVFPIRYRSDFAFHAYEKCVKVVNTGDTLEFEVYSMDDRKLPVKWKRNGVDVAAWNNKMGVEIEIVQPTDAGIYECFHEGRRNTSLFMRAIVRKCRANLYGKDCEQKCPPCYNGGVCHDDIGICVCPEGFTGDNCEVACNEGHFGVDCTKSCNNTDCAYVTFCRPDPFGCACAPGFEGYDCSTECAKGWYGADCRQRCHCASGPDSCNRYTGACDGGCSQGYTGNSCQIEDIH